MIHNVYTKEEALSLLKELMCQEKVAHDDALEPTAMTTTGRSRKRKRSDRKRGDRGLNKFPEDVYDISIVSPIGWPLGPKEALPKYRNALGFCVRDILDITIRH